jgi:DNA polymerase IV
VLAGLVDRVTRRMRTAARTGRTVVLRLRFDDFSRATRSHTLPCATAQTETILLAARALLAASMPLIRSKGLTLVGITVGNLERAPPVQLTLDRRSDELDGALDEVRRRFGSRAVTRAALVGRDLRAPPPLLPD